MWLVYGNASCVFVCVSRDALYLKGNAMLHVTRSRKISPEKLAEKIYNMLVEEEGPIHFYSIQLNYPEYCYGELEYVLKRPGHIVIWDHMTKKFCDALELLFLSKRIRLLTISKEERKEMLYSLTDKYSVITKITNLSKTEENTVGWIPVKLDINIPSRPKGIPLTNYEIELKEWILRHEKQEGGVNVHS